MYIVQKNAMKNILNINLLIFFCLSCNLIDPSNHVDERLQEFVDIVEYEANIRGVKLKPIKVVLDDLPDNVQGRYRRSLTEEKIMINKVFYYDNIEAGLDYLIEQTIFHEYGHYMGRDHTDERYNLMTPGRTILGDNWYNNREQLLNKLFGREPL